MRASWAMELASSIERERPDDDRDGDDRDDDAVPDAEDQIDVEDLP